MNKKTFLSDNDSSATMTSFTKAVPFPYKNTRMKPVAEPFEMRKTNFSKWLFTILFILTIVVFIISLDEPGSKKWLFGVAIVFFGAGLLVTYRHKLLIDQQGILVRSVPQSTNIRWSEISSLEYEIVYHGHGLQYMLNIRHTGSKTVVSLPAKQYNKTQFLRLAEILDEQCPLAIKNDAFKKLASGQLNWKEKLKML